MKCPYLLVNSVSYSHTQEVLAVTLKKREESLQARSSDSTLLPLEDSNTMSCVIQLSSSSGASDTSEECKQEQTTGNGKDTGRWE